jgi:hypothetical protein
MSNSPQVSTSIELVLTSVKVFGHGITPASGVARFVSVKLLPPIVRTAAMSATKPIFPHVTTAEQPANAAATQS